MGIAQFSSGLTPFNQAQMDKIERQTQGSRFATKYLQNRTLTVLMGVRQTLLDVNGKGFVKAAAITPLTGLIVGKLIITIDGVAKEFNYTASSSALMVGYYPLIGAHNMVSNVAPVYQDQAFSTAGDKTEALLDDIFFDTNFKIEIHNSGNGNQNYNYFYHVGVLLP